MKKVHEVVNWFGNELVSLYKDKLGESRASGELQNSIAFRVESNSAGYELLLNLEPYWEFIENGRAPGKFPPPDSIIRWIKNKGIIPEPYTLPSGKQVIPSENSLAYLIGRKIANEGYEGKHYLSNSLEELEPELLVRLQEALREDVETDIKLMIFNL